MGVGCSEDLYFCQDLVVTAWAVGFFWRFGRFGPELDEFSSVGIAFRPCDRVDFLRTLARIRVFKPTVKASRQNSHRKTSSVKDDAGFCSIFCMQGCQ